MPSRSKPRESSVEAAIVRFAKESGVYTRKFASPARRGVPDRIFVYRGRVLFLEVKRPGEEPTPLQLHEIGLLRAAGANAEWCDNADRGRCLIVDTLIHPSPLL